ncbi:hypothetical protein FB451DRAFT_1375214 [Mycena latifolia]|nr:hypothetical protein FB451DRAFT_1375214 [Mycena latifolia]
MAQREVNKSLFSPTTTKPLNNTLLDSSYHQQWPSAITHRPRAPPNGLPLRLVVPWPTSSILLSKSPRARLRGALRADIQARANDADEDHRALIRRIADLENQASSFQRPQKRRRRNNRAADADENIENPTTLERRCRAAGRHFALEESLFLVDPQRIWTVNEDDNFDSDNEFEDEDTRIQGQLRDVLGMLPSDAQPLRKSPMIDAAVLAIWLHSADVELVQIGNQTEINYAKRYEIYLARICRGLRMRKRWARDLFTYWDSILFPHAEDSLGENLSTNQQAEQDELNEAMDIFDDAPSVPSSPHRGRSADAAGFEPRTLPHPTADKRAAAVSNAAIANATNAKR